MKIKLFLLLLNALFVSSWEIEWGGEPCEYSCRKIDREFNLVCEGEGCLEQKPNLASACYVEPRLYDFELGENITKGQAAFRSVFHPFMEGDVNDKYNENKNWIYRSGGTPSLNTGPFYDHTYGNETGHYFHVESSIPGGVGEIWMDSPLLVLEGRDILYPCTINFYLHARGLHNHLREFRVELVKCDDRFNRIFLANYSSADPDIPNDDWLYKQVIVPDSELGERVRVRFNGVRKNFRHNAMDWAVDDVSFGPGCFPPSPSPTPSVTPSSSSTSSQTPSNTATSSPTTSPTSSATSSRSPTSSLTSSRSSTPSSSVSTTPTLTQTPSSSSSVTPTKTHTSSLSVSSTVTPTKTHTSSLSISSTVTPTRSQTPSSSSSVTPTQTPSSSSSVTPTQTPSPSVSQLRGYDVFRSQDYTLLIILLSIVLGLCCCLTITFFWKRKREDDNENNEELNINE